MFDKLFRTFSMLSALSFAAFGTAAQADYISLWECPVDQTRYDQQSSCDQRCTNQYWVADSSRTGGGYWETQWYACDNVLVDPNGGTSGGSGGSSGGGGGTGGSGGGGFDPSDPWIQGQCDFDPMCPGANSCLCGGGGGGGGGSIPGGGGGGGGGGSTPGGGYPGGGNPGGGNGDGPPGGGRGGDDSTTD